MFHWLKLTHVFQKHPGCIIHTLRRTNTSGVFLHVYRENIFFADLFSVKII
jgi:hypothetical protein